ncbi:MAG: hypothetical protein CML41_02200 [Rhodobacteraceae bacterium]|nr:hypothetical protein [Paracoccaceae bacterium]
MLIRRARELEGRWETVCETLILFIGTLQDTDLHHGDNFGQMLEEIEEVIADIPMREEWTQLHLFKLCSMSTGNCPMKMRIKRAANGWKTVSQAFYIIDDLARNVTHDDPIYILDFKESIQDIFTEEWLWEVQENAPFQLLVDGYDDNWGIIPVSDSENIGHVEAEHVEAEHVEAEHVEAEHVEAEHVEAEHVEAEHVEAEHVEAEHVEAEHVDSYSDSCDSMPELMEVEEETDTEPEEETESEEDEDDLEDTNFPCLLDDDGYNYTNIM